MSARTYLDVVADVIEEELGPDYPCERELLMEYVLLVRTVGPRTTLEDVHDAWAIHTRRQRPDHRYLVPFNDLPEHVQAMDEPFVAAIRRASVRLGLPLNGTPPRVVAS
jgi:hypothetical protein